MSATASTPPARIPSAAHAAVGAAPRIADDPRRYLQAVDAFARLAPDDVSALLSFVRWRGLRAGEVLFREGAPGSTMVFVVEGSVGVYTEAAGVRQELSRAGVGSFVGEMACLDPSPRSATVEAITPCVVGELSRDAVKTLQTVAPRAAAAIVGAVIRVVVQRIREVDARIDEALAPPPPDTPEPSTHASGSMQRLFDWLRRR